MFRQSAWFAFVLFAGTCCEAAFAKPCAPHLDGTGSPALPASGNSLFKNAGATSASSGVRLDTPVYPIGVNSEKIIQIAALLGTRVSVNISCINDTQAIAEHDVAAPRSRL